MAKLRAFLLILTGVLFLLAPARVAAAPENSAATSVSLAVFQGFEEYRIFFDWHEDMPFEQSRDGNVYTLSFLKKLHPSMLSLEKIATALPENLRQWRIEAAGDRLFMTLILPPSVTANAARDKGAIVLTLRRKNAASAPKKPTASASEKPPASEKPSVAADKKDASAPAQSAAEEKSAERAAREDIARQLAESFSPESAIVNTRVDVIAPVGFGKKRGAASGKKEFSAKNEGGYRIAMLSFPWSKMTALAAFRRGGYLWLVFDRKGDFNFDMEKRIYRDIIHEMVEIPHSRATIYRLVTAEGYNPTFRREGLLWIVDLMYQPVHPKTSVELVLQRKTPFGPRLFIPLTETPDVIPVLDPEIGDLMYVIPLFSLNKGMAHKRSFVDVRFLQTAQGIVVVPKVDDAAIFAGSTGLEIRGAQQTGMRFSSDDMFTYLAKNKIAKDPMAQILDVGVWSLGSGEAFWNTTNDLIKKAAQAPKESRTIDRLILARHYFANGFYPETLGVLRVMAADDPRVSNKAPFLALRGAANFMMRRFEEAVRDLSDPSLRKSRDADFWRAAAKASASKHPELFFDPMKANMGVLQTYPEDIKMRLALTGLRSSVLKRDELAVQNFLEIVGTKHASPAVTAERDFLFALWQEYLGMYTPAIKMMEKLENGTDYKYHAFGGLEKLRMEAHLKRANPKNRVKTAQELMYAWRDGDFEYNLMTQLVAAFEEEKDYAQVLYLLKDMQSRYHDRDEVRDIPKMMEEVFRKLYLDEESGDRLPPVKAIAVYDEFRDLIPKGDKGVQIARTLADRLTAIDLLDKAAELLETHSRDKISDREKGLVGTRLALVRLLNRQPDKAIKALDDSEKAYLTPHMRAQRLYIRAKALKDSGKPDKAAELLEKDDSYESRILRAEIYWDAKEWGKAADIFRTLIKRPTPNVPLTEQEARGVLDWATALRLAGRAKVLVRLRENFLSYMKDTPYAEPFDFITQPVKQGLLDYKTVPAEVGMAERFNSFFKQRVEQLKNETRLSEPLSAPEPAPDGN